MKKFFKFFILAVVAVCLYACNDEYLATPEIRIAKNVYVTHLDGSCDTTYFGDTLQVGDTARIMMGFYGISHPLTIAQAKSEPTALECAFECDPSVLGILEKDAKPEEGYLHFQPDIMLVIVTYRYVAKMAGDYTMNFTVESMAKEPYSRSEGGIKQTIR